MPRYPAIDTGHALRHLRKHDPAMRPLIRRHGPPPLGGRGPAFAYLVQSILHQQLSGKAAATITRRFLKLAGGLRQLQPESVLAMDEDAMRTAGLSRQKIRYVKDLARCFTEDLVRPRRFPFRSDAEISAELTQVLGVGQWTVDMFLIFALGRPDVLPVGDLGVRYGFQRYFSLAEVPGAQEMSELAEPWRPYRSAAVWYLYRLLDSD